MILSEYDFKMKHVKGNANRKADALSRRDDHDQGEEDNKDVKMLQDAWFNAIPNEESTWENEENLKHSLNAI